jgi:hypothetical protein
MQFSAPDPVALAHCAAGHDQDTPAHHYADALLRARLSDSSMNYHQKTHVIMSSGLKSPS